MSIKSSTTKSVRAIKQILKQLAEFNQIRQIVPSSLSGIKRVREWVGLLHRRSQDLKVGVSSSGGPGAETFVRGQGEAL